MRGKAIVLICSILVVLTMASPVQAVDVPDVSYPDEAGDLTRHVGYVSGLGGWIYDQTQLGVALANMDIIESSLTLTEVDGAEVYVFGMTTAAALPTQAEPQDIGLSSVVLLFWFWMIEFGYSDDYSLWNTYDVMLIWDCEEHSYSALVWDYRPCIETQYQPDRVLVGVPDFRVDGATLEMELPVSWLPEENQDNFCWTYITAVRCGEFALEKVNHGGGFTGGHDFWVDWTDSEIASAYPDPIPTSMRPWLYWSVE